MTKLIILLFCSLLVITSLVGLGVHGQEMAYILGLSKGWIIGRLALASFLLMYYFFFTVRRPTVVFALRVMAVGLLYAGLSSVLWGSYASGAFIPVVDIVLAIEGGIVAILASMELPQYERAVLDIASLKLTVLKMMQPARKGKLRTASH